MPTLRRVARDVKPAYMITHVQGRERLCLIDLGFSLEIKYGSARFTPADWCGTAHYASNRILEILQVTAVEGLLPPPQTLSRQALPAEARTTAWLLSERCSLCNMQSSETNSTATPRLHLRTSRSVPTAMLVAIESTRRTQLVDLPLARHLSHRKSHLASCSTSTRMVDWEKARYCVLLQVSHVSLLIDPDPK